MSKYETVGGTVTRGEAFAKLCHLLREAQDQAAVLAHLHNTESGAKDIAIARGWLMVSENLKRMVHAVTDMAKGTLQ